MKYRKLGNTGIELPAVGLGCMGMSHAYGEPDNEESIATLHRALDIGVTFWDTADMYGKGENEKLISKVLVPNRKKVFLATKFGFRFKDNGDVYFDGSPKYLKTAVEASLKRLQTDYIDLYYAHRVDPDVPVEDTVGAMADLVQEGKVRFIGLSEASMASLKKAHSVHPVAALQSEYSLLTRDPEDGILSLCEELGITFVPYSPVGRGLLTNTVDIGRLTEDDFRKRHPRFSPEHWENNKHLAAAFAELASKKECTPAQLAIAWVLAQGENIIPIPGTKKRKYLEENAAAVDIELTLADVASIEELIARYPHTGMRYGEKLMEFVNK